MELPNHKGIYFVVIIGFLFFLSIYHIERNKQSIDLCPNLKNYKIMDHITNSDINRTSSTNNSSTSSKWKGLIKCQKVRIERLQSKCKKYGLLLEDPLHTVNETFLRKITNKILVDDIHNVLLKAIPKTGCTSWKKILVNNTLHYLQWQERVPGVHNWELMRELTGLYTLPSHNKPALIKKVQNYLSILTVRHPLARLESAFRDKVVEGSNKQGVTVTVESVEDTFKEFVSRLIEVHGNRHFDTYMKHAHPCIIPYNYIAKTETANTEMEYIVSEKLSKIGGPVQRNRSFRLSSDKTSNNADIFLPLFSRLYNPKESIEELMSVYGLDMELFGYNWEIRKDGVYATCESYEFDGMCC